MFPKAEKYTLGQKIENSLLETLELSLKAAFSGKQGKLLFLNEIDSKVKLLKTLVRLAGEIKAIDDKKYLLLQEHLQEIGKMIGGWIKYIG